MMGSCSKFNLSLLRAPLGFLISFLLQKFEKQKLAKWNKILAITENRTKKVL